MNISERIKVLRGKQTREQFSEGTGVSAQTLYKYEKQLSTPTIEFVDFICKKFKINYRWLIAGDGPMRLDEEPAANTPPHKQPQLCETAVTTPCIRCGELAEELAEERRERRELSAELREVNAENRHLLKENGDLRERCATFEERQKICCPEELHQTTQATPFNDAQLRA